MAEISLRNMMVGFLIFAMLLAGILALFNLVEEGDLSQDSSGNKITANEGFVNSTKYENLNNVVSSMDGLVSDINSTSADLKDAEVGNSGLPTLALAFVSSVWSSMKIIFGMFVFIPSVILSLLGLFPSNGGLAWVVKYLTAMASVIIIFGVIAYIFGRNE